MNGQTGLHAAGQRPRWMLAGLIVLAAVLAAACSDGGDGGSADTAAALDNRGYAEGHRLVSAAWLEERLDDDSVVIVDLRAAEDYAAGHIPGARQIPEDLSLSRTDEAGVAGQIGTPEQVAGVLGALGVTPESTVVLYDGLSGLRAARALWTFDVYGHAELRILDGGWPAWEAEGLAVSTEPATFETAEYVFAGEPNSAIIANFDEIVAAVSDPEALVCDARSAEEYAGRDVRSEQGGHVPGATNIEWTQAVNDQGEFRPAGELRDLYEGQLLKGDTNGTVYVYCQTGVRAAHTWFVLHDLLGLESVKNYDGSWEEYGNRSDAEIERS